MMSEHEAHLINDFKKIIHRKLTDKTMTPKDVQELANARYIHPYAILAYRAIAEELQQKGKMQ